ncbi:MAG: hypothetical protein U5R31_06845 [Acidimicrobiia bacterium]|nr:hypothetical protein [Acidimicrobiia bacterium]
MHRVSKRLADLRGALDVVATAGTRRSSDILVLGKVEQLERADGEAADLVVLDAPVPATPSRFLRSARGLLDAVRRSGPIRSQARRRARRC